MNFFIKLKEFELKNKIGVLKLCQTPPKNVH